MKEIDAQNVYGYALYKDGKNTRLPYPLEKFSSDVAGRSFHNGRFIQRLREKAASLPKYSSFPFEHIHFEKSQFCHLILIIVYLNEKLIHIALNLRAVLPYVSIIGI